MGPDKEISPCFLRGSRQKDSKIRGLAGKICGHPSARTRLLIRLGTLRPSTANQSIVTLRITLLITTLNPNP